MKSLDDVEDWKIENFKNDYGFSLQKIHQLLSLSCDCLPACFSLDYKVITLPLLLSAKKKVEVFPDQEESDVTIYFEDAHFLKTKRSEIYGWGDFIANYGGLLGKFLKIKLFKICT